MTCFATPDVLFYTLNEVWKMKILLDMNQLKQIWFSVFPWNPKSNEMWRVFLHRITFSIPVGGTLHVWINFTERHMKHLTIQKKCSFHSSHTSKNEITVEERTLLSSSKVYQNLSIPTWVCVHVLLNNNVLFQNVFLFYFGNLVRQLDSQDHKWGKLCLCSNHCNIDQSVAGVV